MKKMTANSTPKISVNKIKAEVTENQLMVQPTLNMAGELDKIHGIQLSPMRAPQRQVSLSRTKGKTEETPTPKEADCILIESWVTKQTLTDINKNIKYEK